MNYSAINIQGNIISSEILEKIRLEDVRHQKVIDFNMHQASSVRDEINLAWNLAVSNWKAFKTKRENLSDSESGTSETRRYWMLPLLQVLGYELTTANAEIINGKSYAISHRSTNKDGFPIHVVGVNQSLDKRAESGGTRLSPHALVQEYLNNNEHMYGLVSNGRFIRILRDATRLSRLSYLEFDLEQILEEGLYVEFALLFRVLHATRMPSSQDSGQDSFLEYYHQESMASGSRIRERLSLAVENSIKDLANGLLKNPANQDLRDIMLNEELSPKEYYLFTLRLVYRILFLLVIEERKLIYPEKRDDDLNRKRSIYYNFYSIQRLTKLAEKAIYVDPRKTDLWQSLMTTFALFENENIGQHLGISPLGSGIFSPDALGVVAKQLVDNETLLRVLRYLVTFENEQGTRVRVNYADLDVEEFGSVYEGLLDYDPEITQIVGEPMFGFVRGGDRSSSGSHYTPEELVRPLIKHSLDYLIEDKLKEADPEKGLLSLTICDVACGSGHILLSAARRVGFELAKIRSREDQPTPTVLRVAVRDVIRHCIYGVDLNPLAVELCKVALWLEAHEPGEPLNFLDHHIKCGNAIVGLAHAEELENGIASEAFKSLSGDEKEIASAFKKRNDQEIKTVGQLTLMDESKIDDELKDVQSDFLNFAKLPENTVEQIAKKEKNYKELTNGKKWWRLKQLADLQVGQFFTPKTTVNKDKLTTHSQYLTYLKQGTQIFDRGASMAISQEKRFFHWFLEFPEVFQKGGFDCILGNPPYKGGSKLSGLYGNDFLNYLKFKFPPFPGQCDLAAAFVRSDFDLINTDGFIGLITTNTICQGDTRIGGLDNIIKQGGKINHAIKSMEWPGAAAVYISILNYTKYSGHLNIELNSKKVEYINSYFVNELNDTPNNLIKYSNLSFKGCDFGGKGFVLSLEDRVQFIYNNEENANVISPLINGDDIVSRKNSDFSRFIINFKDWENAKAMKYDLPFERLKQTVYFERQESKENKRREKWWLYARDGKKLYSQLENKKFCFATPRSTKYLIFDKFNTDIVFSDAVVVITSDDYGLFAILQSNIHSEWAWKYASTLGSSTLRYSNTDVVETFPFPEVTNSIREIGEYFYEFRKKIVQDFEQGLTDIYNQIHNKLVVDFQFLEVRGLLQKIDYELLKIYGWHLDDPKWGKAIHLRHDFYEVDYLPENDRIRYSIHPDARKEVLKRLLQLNHERYAEEVEKGLHSKAKLPKVKTEAIKKAKKIPMEYDYQSDIFERGDSRQVAEDEVEYVTNSNSSKIIGFGSIVTLMATNGKTLHISCGVGKQGVQTIELESGLYKAIEGKSEGDYIQFGNGFNVVKVV